MKFYFLCIISPNFPSLMSFMPKRFFYVFSLSNQMCRFKHLLYDHKSVSLRLQRDLGPFKKKKISLAIVPWCFFITLTFFPFRFAGLVNLQRTSFFKTVFLLE